MGITGKLEKKVGGEICVIYGNPLISKLGSKNLICEKKKKSKLSNTAPPPSVENSRGFTGMKEQNGFMKERSDVVLYGYYWEIGSKLK
ncbi:hypothetical protein Leryth_026754 [Lithospermum erythrorhizon]|nr:hypothetical protein Leryth_026754 [Lithospermum erythrorhizon]